MKRILLLCGIFTILANVSFGQTDKLVFASEIGRFEANVSRNRTDLYQSAFANLTDMMKKEIAQNKTEVAALSGDAKKALQAKIDDREHYFGEIKAMSDKPSQNATAIKSRLDLFLQTL